MFTDIALPEDIQADLDMRRQSVSMTKAMRLDDISRVIAEKRDEAVKERKGSGIEEVWRAAEEAYLGMDDANRHEFGKAKWAKPTTMDGPVTTEHQRNHTQEYRSTVFVRLTARYVDAGAAKVAEILLPPDDKPFSIEPTPVPDLINLKEDESQVMGPDGLPLERDPRPEEVAPVPPSPAASPSAGPGVASNVGQTATAATGPSPVPGPAAGQPQAGQPPVMPPGVNPADLPGQPLKVKDLVQEALEKATDKAKKAETRIHDWMVESLYTAEVRKVIFDAAKLGGGVLKGPFPKVTKAMALSQQDGATVLAIKETIVPWSKRIDPWNLFPDPCCGEDIHQGDYIIERDRISRRQLKDLMDEPHYLPRQIQKVLKEGPGKKYLDDQRPDANPNDDRYEIWYFTGSISREDLCTINHFATPAEQPESYDETIPKDRKDVYIQAVLINDTINKAVLNPLESGSFGYHVMPWQRREGSWAGVGVAEQASVPQRIVNAGTRALLNNAGQSAGGIVVVDRSQVEPGDGHWAFGGGIKFFLKKGDTPGDDVRKAFTTFTFPNMQAALQAIIDYGFRLAEESTNIPLITQGQSGETTPETLGGMQLQNNNANQLLRSIGYMFDDCITDPVVRDYYEWLLLDPNVPDEEKGDYKINAHGSPSLVERSIQNQEIAQMAAMAANPIYKLAPDKWAVEYMKSRRLDPRNFKPTEDEQAKIDQTPPPPPPQVQAAQIRAEVDKMRVEMMGQMKQMEVQMREQIAARDTDRDTVYVQAERERTESERQLRMEELRMKLQLAQLDYAAQHQITVEELKTKLADTAMKLNVQRELSEFNRDADMQEHVTPPAVKPPTEPAGRAKPGEAFQA